MAIFLHVRRILRNAISYLCAVGIFIVIAIPTALVLLVAPDRYMQKRGPVFGMLNIVYHALTLVFLMPRHFYGTDNIPDQPAIIVANHQSSLDILVIGALLNGAPHAWYALAYYAQHPVFGLFLRRLGLPVDARNPNMSAKSLLQGMRAFINNPRHVIIFPEGGRYTDDEIHPFFRGFAVLARATNRPVVPIYMPNNGAIFGPDAYLTNWHPIVAQVGQTFYLHEDESDEAFVARVREWFVQQAETWT